MAPKVRIDWEMIEPEFRAGVKSLSQICAWYAEQGQGNKVSKASIVKHFKALGVTRDLKAKIQSKAAAIVNAKTAAMVNEKVNGAGASTKAKDVDVIDANAEVQAALVLRHRKDISDKTEFCCELFAELRSVKGGIDVIKQMELALKDADLDKLATAAGKLAGLTGRIKGFSDLVGSYKHLIALEREAFNVQPADGDPKNDITEIVRRIVRPS